ncbi:hypothetical protein [Treponema sp. Marseille-Q3903]|uniref:hypothetical protein n=1 Tax=Treponema sp. Marseille-Q3903 TaxID=2766703 RepID=UPI00165230E5|nr:hypothetical protein [Treponema sp. Marseille-Q3903]MBC6713713.1 hypothetical protein [Treponema sp. Marseille-Q3903]
MGLLTKASLLELEDGLSFFELISKHSLKICAVFDKVCDKYFISDSIGFDFDSIISSFSTVDFWNGICPKTEMIYSFSADENSISPFLQFFSFEIKDDITSVSVYKNKCDDKIIVCCNKKLDDKIISDFQQTLKNSSKNILLPQKNQPNHSFFMFKIHLSEAVNNFINQKFSSHDDIKTLAKKALENEIKNRLSCFFEKPGISVENNKNILAVFSLQSDFPSTLLISHIVENYKDVSATLAKSLKIDFIGKTDSFDEVSAFLKVE